MTAAVSSLKTPPDLVSAKKNSDYFELTLAALRISNPISVPTKNKSTNEIKSCENKSIASENDSNEKKIWTLDEISDHDQPDDCWVVIYDRVYDVTEFLDKHPGGSDVLLEYAGRDASMAFRGVGHSIGALESLERYRIGQLPHHECIFRTATGLRLSGIPD